MKNEETLVLRNRKYVGGGLNDGFITIKSPTKADRGTYSCTVTNAVGSVSKNITLGTCFLQVVILIIKNWVNNAPLL